MSINGVGMFSKLTVEIRHQVCVIYHTLCRIESINVFHLFDSWEQNKDSPMRSVRHFDGRSQVNKVSFIFVHTSDLLLSLTQPTTDKAHTICSTQCFSLSHPINYR